LLYRILIGLVLGIVLGLMVGERILWIAPLGDLFIRLLRMIILPIIFSTLIVGASSVSPATLGRVGIRVMIFYTLSSFVAISVGLLMGAIFRPSVELSGLVSAESAAGRASEAPPLTQTLLEIVPLSIARAIVNETILAVIFFALIFGLALSYLRLSDNPQIKASADTVYNFFDGVAQTMMLIIKGIMQYAPIGVFALVSVVFATNGPRVIGSLGILTIACFSAYAFLIVIFYFGLIRLYGGLSIRTFVGYVKEPFITGFVTRSSSGTLPVTMEAARKMGIPKDVYSFSLPLGATINMDGTAVYQGVCVTFIALSVWGHGFDAGQLGVILLTATLATIGTAGVPGAGALMLLMVLESIGLPVQTGTMVAAVYAMILGIDAILDMGRTAINVIGDLVYTICVCKRMKTLDISKWYRQKA
jgi:Na+/H+-dicarboxylate symporter